MTFEQFQATKTECADLGEKLSDSRWDDEPTKGIGLIYIDKLYIEQVQPHWPEAVRNAGQWYLVIGNQEWVSDDLTSLERHLYEYAISEGYLEDTTPAPEVSE